MTNFTITPTSPGKVITATFVHADGTTDTGYSAPITWSIDKPSLIALGWSSTNANVPNNECTVDPIRPAANAGGVATITASSTDENSNPISSSFTVTISVNPNPATGFTFA